MARARRKSGSFLPWLLRVAGIVVLTGIGFAMWLWWDMREWRPDPALYPQQGAVIASGAGRTRFETLAATGAAFVYLELAPASDRPDPGFASRLESAMASELKVGVVAPFDPCLSADVQSARYTRMVPREASLLPPAIALGDTGAGCLPAVSQAAVESELMTLVNQIEMHAGKPVILKLERGFAERHETARTTARDLWLMRDRARPDYAGRPWLLWSANSQRVSEATRGPIEWVVVQR
ncbi:glycoside hydrolase family 25 protein [Erythrobacter sp.]|jgi:lysozyme|uniref:glycoside hydrolase family 25 protein n=1 Tax=Erythrobacter sp. TaxID=1042 RepID=UPI002EA6FBAA|nr:glycoside hydrolase family 25 protein [Erythrobacter sp.]